MNALAKKLKEFASEDLLFRELDESFCIEFYKYLSKHLNGKTPQTYFARFKKVITAAT